MKKTNGAAAVLRRSWKMVSPYRGKIYLGAVCSILATGLSAISAYTLRVLVDDILPMKRAEALWPIQFVFIGAVLCSSLMTVLQSFLFAQAGEKSQRDLRSRLFRRLLRADPLERQKKTEAVAFSAINHQVDALSGILENGIPTILVSVVDIAVTLGIMFALDWRLTALSLPVFPMIVLLNAFMRRRVSAIQRTYQVARRDMTEVLSDVTTGASTVETYRLEQYVSERFDRGASMLAGKSVHLSVLYRIMGLASWAMIMVPYQAILYGVGGSWLMAGTGPTIGLLLIFANYTNHLVQPVMQLASVSGSIGAAQNTFEMLDEFEDSLPEKIQVRYSRPETSLAASAEGLTYAYPDREAPCIRDLSFQIPKEQIAVLWGKSGCGKSTLLKILFGTLPLQNSEALRLDADSRWGYFPQDPHMLRLTLRENFRLADPEITDGAIWDILQAFSVEQTVRRYPEGLDHVMRRSEGELSLGEYRRVCLAIFWSANFDVMLLDEPTASLDAENIRFIAQALGELRKERTLIVATHEQALLPLADCTIRL